MNNLSHRRQEQRAATRPSKRRVPVSTHPVRLRQHVGDGEATAHRAPASAQQRKRSFRHERASAAARARAARATRPNRPPDRPWQPAVDPNPRARAVESENCVRRRTVNHDRLNRRASLPIEDNVTSPPAGFVIAYVDKCMPRRAVRARRRPALVGQPGRPSNHRFESRMSRSAAPAPPECAKGSASVVGGRQPVNQAQDPLPNKEERQNRSFNTPAVVKARSY